MGSTTSCAICLENNGEAEDLIKVSENCSSKGHVFCRECLLSYSRMKFMAESKAASPLGISCPGARCSEKLSLDLFKELVQGDDEMSTRLEQVLATIPSKAADLTLDDFNYIFTSEGNLRHKLSGAPFHFISQFHYDQLGDIIVEHIYSLLVSKCGLEKVCLPVNGSPPFSPIFMSPDALTADRLMLLICGSGAVRAGQWARALCINDSLEIGTCIPYIERCKANGVGLIVLNPNLTSVEVVKEAVQLEQDHFLGLKKIDKRDGSVERCPIEGNETPTAHVLYVFDHFVAKAAASDLSIVAHSAGGHGACVLLRERAAEVLPRLRGLAFTDSVHSIVRSDPEEVKSFIKEHAQNWVTSDEPLDTAIPLKGADGCPCVSAGHEKHEWTSGCAVESVLRFLCDKMGLVYQFESKGEPSIDYSDSDEGKKKMKLK